MADVVLCLYIAGKTAVSRRAEQHLVHLREHMKNPNCEIRIVDVLSNPELAEGAGVLATPTLSYEHPIRSRRVVGDLSESRRILDFLGIEAKDDQA